VHAGPTVTRLDAAPVSSLLTLVSPTRKISTKSTPRPTARSIFGPSIPPANVLREVIRDSQNIPPAAIALPAISSGRAPIRVTPCCATTDAARFAGTNGSQARPVFSGLYPPHFLHEEGEEEEHADQHGAEAQADQVGAGPVPVAEHPERRPRSGPGDSPATQITR
jgi:hypothetical protein